MEKVNLLIYFCIKDSKSARQKKIILKVNFAFLVKLDVCGNYTMPYEFILIWQ